MEHRLTLSRSHWDAMRAHVQAGAPLEACGMLGGRNGCVEVVITVTNAAGSPVRFRMDPREQLNAFEQIESAELEVLAVFHSHPTGPFVPSPTDIEESAYQVISIIWSPVDGKWQARGFWIEDGHAAEVPLVVV